MVQYSMTHGSLGKKNSWYIQPQTENRQIPLVNSYYTVNEWCATFNSHNALLSVQILKYSSLRFGLKKNELCCAGHLGIEGFVIVFFWMFYIHSCY